MAVCCYSIQAYSRKKESSYAHDVRSKEQLRGVKLIGATAHYVTTDLDEEAIIEQTVERVDHTHTPDMLAAVGRDSECQALARAVRFHTEHRVFLNGANTIVFR